MQVHHVIPYSLSKNLGLAYNESMSLIPDGDTALFTDYDVMLLTPDARAHIQAYAEMYPGAVLTCYTNRIHQLSQQNFFSGPSEEKDILFHHNAATKLQEEEKSVTELTENISGFLMIVPKDVWQRCSFPENGKCLGVDSEFFKRAIKKGIKVLRMNTVYVFHLYRLSKSITDKKHLL